MVYLFPYEGSNDRVKEALKFFGDIKEVRHQQWSNVPGVHTGTRLVRMMRKMSCAHDVQLISFRFRNSQKKCRKYGVR